MLLPLLGTSNTKIAPDDTPREKERDTRLLELYNVFLEHYL